jgi:hypothetical protein
MVVYKIVAGDRIQYVMGATYTQAELGAAKLFSGQSFTMVPATQEEINALYQAHSYPEDGE